MLHSLSLRMPMNFLVVWEMLLSASKEMPLVSAASPKMQTTFSSVPRLSRAAAMPSAADSAVPAWPAPKQSCGLSVRKREAVQAVGLADGVKAILAAGENLVDVNLMAHIPDELVLGRAEDVVQGDGQFHDAEIRAEMAAALGEDGDQLLPDFVGQLSPIAAASVS